MQLWHLFVSFFENVPLYYQTNHILFVMTVVAMLVNCAMVIYSYSTIVAGVSSTAYKLVYLLIVSVGMFSFAASGIAFIAAQEVAVIRPEVLTRTLFIEIAFVAAAYAGLRFYSLATQLDSMENEDAWDVAESVFMGAFVVVYSVVGVFAGSNVASWGITLFGRTLGTWLFGAYLAWTIKAILGVATTVIQTPLLLLFGNPDSKVEEVFDSLFDTIGDAFGGDSRHKDVSFGKAAFALATVALVVGLGVAVNHLQESASIPEDHVMNWDDPVLEGFMRDITGIAEGDIWLHDVWDLKELDLTAPASDDEAIDGPYITNISALAELTNLQSLSIAFQKVDDLSPIASCTHLESLTISHTPVSNLAPLSGLTRLDELWAWDCDISDVTPLSGLTSLRYLSLSYNNITSVEALSNLRRLDYLDLRDNPIVDYSPVEQLEIDQLVL